MWLEFIFKVNTHVDFLEFLEGSVSTKVTWRVRARQTNATDQEEFRSWRSIEVTGKNVKAQKRWLYHNSLELPILFVNWVLSVVKKCCEGSFLFLVLMKQKFQLNQLPQHFCHVSSSPHAAILIYCLSRPRRVT